MNRCMLGFANALLDTAMYKRAVLRAPISRAFRRLHCVGGGAPVNFGRRRRAAGSKKSAAAAARRGVGDQKHFFLRFTKKFRSILKIFLGTFLVIKALRFADDQC